MKTLGIAAAASIAFTASLLPFGGESYAATNAHVGAAQSELLAKGGASQPESQNQSVKNRFHLYFGI